MLFKPKPAPFISVVIILLFVITFFFALRLAHSLVIEPENVQSTAIYGWESNYGVDLQRHEINFNITSRETINTLITSVEFSTVRDCSVLGGEIDAYLYIKFIDTSIEVYSILDTWSHLCKPGIYEECYYISVDGQLLFESLMQ